MPNIRVEFHLLILPTQFLLFPCSPILWSYHRFGKNFTANKKPEKSEAGMSVVEIGEFSDTGAENNSELSCRQSTEFDLRTISKSA
jgi:hypothetical protein